jgi:hypothetical protein
VNILKDELKNEIIEDFDRAKNAFASSKRNFDEEDMFTAANRLFVACENTVYACMKQADYGRKSKIVEFNKERIGEIIIKVQKLISDIEKELKKSGII